MFIVKCLEIFRAFLGGSAVKNSPAMQEMQFQSLGWEDPLEEEMATYSSILAWEIPWTEEPGRLQAMGSQKFRHDLATKQQHRDIYIFMYQFSSVPQSCLTLCDPMNRSMRGLPIHHQLPKFTQTHVHQISDAIQPSHPLSSPSPPAPKPSQHQSLFQ